MFAKGSGGVHEKNISVLSLLLDNARLELEVAKQSSPDDIRAKGWTVAVHNDYRLNGEAHTFWAFSKGDWYVKGEGKSDREALNIVRKEIERIHIKEIDAIHGV